MPQQITPPEFSRLIVIEDIDRQHKTYKVEANAAECQLIATRFNLVSLDFLTAQCEIWRESKYVFCIKGTITAKVTQECVVTGSPIDTAITEEFEEKFAHGKYDDDDESEDLELIESAEIDIGEVVAQYFSLALNPYPRKLED